MSLELVNDVELEQQETLRINDNYNGEYRNDLEEFKIKVEDVVERGELVLDIDVHTFLNAPSHQNIKGQKVKVGGHEWSILSQIRNEDQDDAVLSFFVVMEDVKTLGPKDFCCASFSLMAKSHHDDLATHKMCTQYAFKRMDSDWGFKVFMKCSEIKRLGYITDKLPLRLKARVTVCRGLSKIFLDKLPYDSKKMTGYVGMRNQGATCYMNSVLQSFFLTNKLRRAVFQIDTTGDQEENSVSLALQRVFYQLMTSDEAVDTVTLTKSFGWTSADSFRQHDVQEFSRILTDNLENKMKNTAVDGVIKGLFEGKMKSFIKCINVNFESSRTESFYDIQLNVKGKKNLKESFEDYISIETLEDENKYQAEGYGYQDARKGVIFQSFPPVLHMQLKRFEYDFTEFRMVKINDRYEYPEKINLDPYLEKTISPQQQQQQTPANYTLVSVLVHSGDIGGGHYVVYIKPKHDKQKELVGETQDWLKFDDDRVTKVDASEAIEGNYGVSKQTANINHYNNQSQQERARAKLQSFTNAYMLVYVRDDMLDEVMKEITIKDVPGSLISRFEGEQEREARLLLEKEKLQQFIELNIITMNDIENYGGIDIVHPNVLQMETTYGCYNTDNTTTCIDTNGNDVGVRVGVGNANPELISKIGLKLNVKRDMLWRDFCSLVTSKTKDKVPMDCQRYWCMQTHPTVSIAYQCICLNERQVLYDESTFTIERLLLDWDPSYNGPNSEPMMKLVCFLEDARKTRIPIGVRAHAHKGQGRRGSNNININRRYNHSGGYDSSNDSNDSNDDIDNLDDNNNNSNRKLVPVDLKKFVLIFVKFYDPLTSKLRIIDYHLLRCGITIREFYNQFIAKEMIVRTKSATENSSQEVQVFWEFPGGSLSRHCTPDQEIIKSYEGHCLVWEESGPYVRELFAKMKCRLPNLGAYYDHLDQQVDVTFVLINNNSNTTNSIRNININSDGTIINNNNEMFDDKEDNMHDSLNNQIVINLNKRMTYDEVAQQLAAVLLLSWSKNNSDDNNNDEKNNNTPKPKPFVRWQSIRFYPYNPNNVDQVPQQALRRCVRMHTKTIRRKKQLSINSQNEMLDETENSDEYEEIDFQEEELNILGKMIQAPCRRSKGPYYLGFELLDSRMRAHSPIHVFGTADKSKPTISTTAAITASTTTGLGQERKSETETGLEMMTVAEIERMKEFRVVYGTTQQVAHVLMKPGSTVRELIKAVRIDLNIDEKIPLRLLQLVHHRIYIAGIDPDELCDVICDSSSSGNSNSYIHNNNKELADLRIEEVPKSHLNVEEGVEKLVQVCHFHQKSKSLHGNPFLFMLKQHEPFHETYKRLILASGIPEAVFSKKIKVAKISNSNNNNIVDDDVQMNSDDNNSPPPSFEDNRGNSNNNNSNNNNNGILYLTVDEHGDYKLFDDDFSTHFDFIGLDHPGRSTKNMRSEQSIKIRGS